MTRTTWSFIAALAFGLAVGCGESQEAEPPQPAAASASEQAPSEPVAQAGEAEPAGDTEAAADGEEGEEPLVPVDFEEGAAETVTEETIETQLAELEAAIAAEDIFDEDEDEEEAE